MRYINRLIDKELVAWKESANHKPLLLRGARQVGKSRAIRHLGESFEYYIEVNFEKRPELKDLFKRITDVRELTEELSILYNTPVIPGKTLVFLDEIQVSPEAIKSLWFFKEDYPELHVAAAGSLLEFALKNITSYGVGRIRSLFIYPFSFDEFLAAQGKVAWIEVKRKANHENPLSEALHKELVQQFRRFLIIGGMPASVSAWLETKDYTQCQAELDDIQLSYYDDFVKYAERVDTMLLRNTLQSVVAQMGRKFMYSKVEGGYRTEEVKKALSMLCDAGIIKRVSHTAANGLPLGAEVNDKFRKYIYLDSGLLLRILDLNFGGVREYLNVIITGASDELVNKGGLTEMVLGWELIKYGTPRSQHDLFYWENTIENTNSEVDYILAYNMKVLPIECKSGTSGKMKSLRLFMRNKHIEEAIRCSLENFSSLELKENDGSSCVTRHIYINPLYAVSTICFNEQ